MKRSIKSVLATIVLSLSLVTPVLAGPFEDASSRGDYATAMRLLHPPPDLGRIPPYTPSSRAALDSAFYDRVACLLACENVGFWAMETELTHNLINACKIGCKLGQDHCR